VNKLPTVKKIAVRNPKTAFSQAGYLITIANPNRRELLLLAKWRRKNQHWFGDDHEINLKSTQKWWQTVEANPLRILFWVQNLKGDKIGHMGLNRFKAKSCELDNVIRGPKGSAGLMTQAVLSLIDWVFKHLPIKRIYLQTNYDNSHAIKFYERCGFKMVKKTRPRVKMRYFP